MSNVFFTSDEHLGHKNIVQYMNRPVTVHEMAEFLSDRHNSKVKAGDRVYHLGDMFWWSFGLKAALDYFHSLNGQHYFIWGNHDELISREPVLAERFVWIKDLHDLKVDGFPKITLCHYAMKVWNGSHKGSWHLFGHSHGELEGEGLSFDVGVDCNDYYPVSIEEVAARMATRKQHHVVTNPWPGKELS